MYLNGSAKPNTSALEPQLLAPFEGNVPPSMAADVTRVFTINQTDVVTWIVDGYPYLEPETPIIYGNASDGWNANTTLHMPFNSTIDIIMRIANDSLDTVSYRLFSDIMNDQAPTTIKHGLTVGHCKDGPPYASSRA